MENLEDHSSLIIGEALLHTMVTNSDAYQGRGHRCAQRQGGIADYLKEKHLHGLGHRGPVGSA